MTSGLVTTALGIMCKAPRPGGAKTRLARAIGAIAASELSACFLRDVAAAIEAGMCFVNSQNVRDLRQPFGGTKASGIGREGGTWSYEVFLEPKNVSVSMGAHHIPHWGT